MSNIPTGTELARPFIPTKDFDLSKRFYEVLGFEKVLDSEVAIFRAGSGGFILQRLYHKEWAAHCMMQLMVDDLDGMLTRCAQHGVTPIHLQDEANGRFALARE